MKIENALKKIKKEYLDASIKFSSFNSAHEGWAVIFEELDELWDEVKANNEKAMKFEAIQVAAMALKFLIDICDE